MYQCELPPAHYFIYLFVTFIFANWITNNKRKQSFKDKQNMIPKGFGMLSFTKILKIYLHPPSLLFNGNPVLYLSYTAKLKAY
jgi:hypothetical protein